MIEAASKQNSWTGTRSSMSRSDMIKQYGTSVEIQVMARRAACLIPYHF